MITLETVLTPIHAGDPGSPAGTLAYFGQHFPQIMSWTWSHAWLSVLPVAIGLLISLPLGWLAYRYRWSYPPIVSFSGIFYAIPSIALFVILPGILHTEILSPINVVVALTVYTIALMVRVVADGLGAVSEEVTQAASAMGYTTFQRLTHVELPNAVPVISAGLRVATVSNVSMVAVAATVGVPELGQLFTNGFQLSAGTPFYPPIILGIVLCVLLAVILDGIIIGCTWLLTPWRRSGIRHRAHRSFKQTTEVAA